MDTQKGVESRSLVMAIVYRDVLLFSKPTQKEHIQTLFESSYAGNWLAFTLLGLHNLSRKTTL